jgi:hypothetical protein
MGDMQFCQAIVFNLIILINQNRKNQMKSKYSFLTAVVFLMSISAFAQKTMFGSNNNYVAPFINVPTGTNPVTTELKMYLDATRTASYSGTGTIWSDISGVTPANNVTLSANLIFGQSSVSNGSGSFTFNGSSGAYATPTSAINLTTATFIAWVNPAVGCPDYSGIIMNRGQGGNGSVTGLLLGGKPSGSQEHYIVYNWNNEDQYPQTLLVPNNQWSMIAVSISSTKAEVYLFNAAGSSTHSRNYSHAVSNNNRFFIGRDPITDPGRNYRGKIGTAMIYNAALTSQNITAIYNAQKVAFGL